VAVVIVDERAVVASVSFVGLKEFDKEPADQVAEGCRHRRGPALRPRADRPCRAGDQAPVPVAQPVRRRGGDHHHAHRAQSRQHHLHHDRGRCCPHPRDPHRRCQGVLRESTLLDLFDLTTGGWLTWYTKSDRYSRSQAQCRPGDAARLLRQPRLPRVRRRVDSGHDLARQAGDLDLDLDQGRPALHGDGDPPGRRLPGQGRRVQVAGAPAARPALPRRGGHRDHQGSSRTCSGPTVMPLPASSTARDRPCQRPGGRGAAGRPAAPRLCAPHRRGGQHAHARRGDPPRVPATRVGLVRRHASSCPAIASTAWVTSRTSVSTPTKCRARPIRST
jgi:hypothetical protein